MMGVVRQRRSGPVTGFEITMAMMMHIGIRLDRGECEKSRQRPMEGPLPGAELVVGVGGVSGGDHGAGGEGPEEGDRPPGGVGREEARRRRAPEDPVVPDHTGEFVMIGILQKMTQKRNHGINVGDEL